MHVILAPPVDVAAAVTWDLPAPPATGDTVEIDRRRYRVVERHWLIVTDDRERREHRCFVHLAPLP